VECLESELNQVWTNLIHNALQAMHNSGALKVSVFAQDGGVAVSVADNGPGIPEDIKVRIFEPFFTTKPIGEGSGLGLDIVKKILDKHHGRIDLHSEIGVGTTFTVWLPLQQPAESGS
jgi:signal transduction histidine kinase